MRETLRLKLSQLFNYFIKSNHSQELTRFWLLRGMGFLYFCAFFPLIFQFKPLLGSDGLLPMNLFLQKTQNYLGELNHFWAMPNIFWLNSSDSFGLFLIFLGVLLSILVMVGFANFFILLTLWIIQLSIYYVGQTFWGFGWEMNLIELGFLALFLVPIFNSSPFSSKLPPPEIILFFFRLVLFKVMLGSGLIKIRGDSCWQSLECLSYHFETQPIPGLFSPFLHHLPKTLLKGGVIFNHVVEIIFPWFIFLRGNIRKVTGIIFTLFQIILILSGNYGWINYLTLVMIIPCFDDSFLQKLTPKNISKKIKSKTSLDMRKHPYFPIQVIVSIILLYLSIKPLKNLIGPNQVMNASYDRFALVNTYGLFGGITRSRYEIIMKGTTDKKITKQTLWKEYSIPCKPGFPSKRPCMASPYHYRLAWQIWFAAIDKDRIQPWILHWVYKLLLHKKGALSLLEDNPFPKSPPAHIKMDLYLYNFNRPKEYKKDDRNLWYKRKFIRNYLPPLNKNHPELRKFIYNKGWPIY